MRYRLALTAVSMAVAVFSLGGGPYAYEDPVEAMIQEQCATEWPDNRRMRGTCVEQKRKILNKSLRPPSEYGLPLEDQTLVREKCAGEWPDDFRMRAKCEQIQIQGYLKLQSPPPKDVTLKDYSVAVAHCSKEWPDDFRLRARCLEEQLADMRMHPDLSGFDRK
jgi:hypothetical protein